MYSFTSKILQHNISFDMKINIFEKTEKTEPGFLHRLWNARSWRRKMVWIVNSMTCLPAQAPCMPNRVRLFGGVYVPCMPGGWNYRRWFGFMMRACCTCDVNCSSAIINSLCSLMANRGWKWTGYYPTLLCMHKTKVMWRPNRPTPPPLANTHHRWVPG